MNELECRLLAPRLAFQKLMQAPRGRQFKILGNVVNVVAEVSNTVNVLPRLPSDTGTIKVNLKRKLQYKSSAMSFNVRPHKVIQAANWLINNSSLYRQEGITVNQVWGVEYRDNCLVDERNIENEHKGLQNIVNSCVNTSSNTNCDEVVETEDQWSEDEVEIPAGVTDTMLTNTNFVEDNESHHILNVAPGEGNKPLSIFRDQYSEELAYPGIFLRQKRPENKESKIVSCKWPIDDPQLQKLVNRQIHRHSHTCRKKSKSECRFNYPQPPMRATEIMYPLGSDISQHEIKKHKETWKTIKKQLNDLKDGESITFEELLLKLSITENNYRLAIRTALNSPTIFLKREPSELRINSYNPTCLKAWRANMDIQFVLDIYACAMYIVSYISKAQKGMSKLL